MKTVEELRRELEAVRVKLHEATMLERKLSMPELQDHYTNVLEKLIEQEFYLRLDLIDQEWRETIQCGECEKHTPVRITKWVHRARRYECEDCKHKLDNELIQRKKKLARSRS